MAPHVSPPEAMEFFHSARERYREGRYAEAITDLERALVLDPASATLRYNLGRVYELTGELAPALLHYRRYLDLLPADDEEERSRTAATIARLEGALASGEAQPQNREVEPLRELQGAVIVSERGVADEAFWITLGGGAAALVASIVTGALALDRAGARDALVLTDAGQIESHRAQYASLDEESRALALSTDVLLGVGGAAALASLLLFALRERSVEREVVRGASSRGPSMVPFVAVSPGAAMVGMRGSL